MDDTRTMDDIRTAAITALQDVLLDTAGIEEFLEGVARAAAQRVGSATSATITLRRDGRATLVAASDPRAAECDLIEYAAAEGPCLSSIDLGQTVHVPDLARETRWPAWREASQQHGYSSAAALPRPVRPGADIALNLYSTESNAWDEAAVVVADIYADEVARAMTLSLRAADQAELNADLRAALVSRAVIDQAIGVIMAENRCSVEDAMSILRSASRHRKVKLREVAAAIIEGVTGRAPSEADTFQERA
ncbi:GAF and ANTAR domain-containing protein [Cellulomonas sp. URHE0023]|uniref:GAF and ANTAR domain-containing protein n=1 Tax=Cellulomonas sp. URHE0023 TaxID=1380354 RepID=UPI000485C25F|nr:GAF and ANTAR domain-containing protein [Cellulomonas sp. URHE0023]